MNEILIAPETAAHGEEVLTVNRLAFEREAEAELVARLRVLGERQISLVALLGDQVVGHILFTTVSIAEAPTLNAYGLGPLAVSPGHQSMGIGGRLIEAGMAACAERGVDAVFVLGHAEYYLRFAFTPAGGKGFHYESLEKDPHFFCREIKSSSLNKSFYSVSKVSHTRLGRL